MSIQTRSPLSRFAGWIEATDDHAEHHLELLRQADQALSDGDTTAAPQRQRLAQRLERWRYQHLNEHAPCLTSGDEDLIDALDMAANQLAGGPARPPRATRHAITDPVLDGTTMRQVLAALDPNVPLDELAARATQLTQQHFGEAAGRHRGVKAQRRMLLYAPLYVSNDCVNHCLYCGFRYPLDIERKQLTVEQAVEQARILWDRGFRHLLVVAGDYPGRMTTQYFTQLIDQLVGLGIAPAIEIAAQSTWAYGELVAAGVCGLTLYQETYDPRLYAEYHPRGPKSSFHWRLEAHDRAAEAGVSRLGLGILLGLADPRAELLAMIRHATYLRQRFPRCRLAFSLPRIHQAPDGFRVRYPCSDEQLIRLYCALRLAMPEAELVLSTREPVALRDRLARICITQMSAGSSTAPGGYRAANRTGSKEVSVAPPVDAAVTETTDRPAGQQFPVVDHRSPAAVADWLRAEGFQVTWTPERE